MDEIQFLKWLNSHYARCNPGDPEKILEETKRTGRCKWKNKDGRDYKVVYMSVHNQFVVEW